MKRERCRNIGEGFTLIEALIASVLIGLGVAALFISFKAGTQVNASSRELTQAVFVAQEIREWTLKLPFTDPDEGDQGNPPGPDGADPQVWVDDLDDLMDVVYSPPRGGDGYAIYGMDEWSQHITLTWRDPENLGQTLTPGASDVVRVHVDITRNARTIMNTSWIVTGKEQP